MRSVHQYRGASSLRACDSQDLLTRFEEVRLAEQLEETAGQLLRRTYGYALRYDITPGSIWPARRVVCDFR